jgi:hypothetical protein
MFGRAEPLGWLYYADNSYVATRLLWFTGLPLDSAVYGHRTIELYIKAFLVSRGVEVKPGSPAWGHDLAALGEAAASYDPGFRKEAVARRLRFFERYFDYVRYPGDLVAPADGSQTWFAFNANITPLDELVAFIRPRIRLEDEDWQRSVVHTLVRGSDAERGYQHRALTDGNAQVDVINCLSSAEPQIAFDPSFRYDKPGC